MCGICGVASPAGGEPEVALVRSMCESIRHRGPDDEGLVARGGVVLGMRRLSIIDVEGGHQPMGNESGDAWIVFNGELYNHRELREELRARGHGYRTSSDTETVVHAYEEWGDGFLERLNGMFALALWDERRRRLLLVRDRMGIKPLYYRHSGGRLTFGSELKALLRDPACGRDVDLGALDEYLALEYVPPPRTILAEVRKLPAGHLLEWRERDGSIRVERWWDVDLSGAERARPLGSVREQAEMLLSVLRESVRMEMVSDVPIGVFLSGGVDSSAVAAMMAEQSPGHVRSFAIGFTDRSFDESGYARRVAEHLGTDHSELTLEPSMMVDLVPRVAAALDEPLADASIIPTFLLSEFTRRSVKVALGGDGGDELFAGYPTVLAHRLAGYYEALPAAVRRRVVPALVDRLPVSLDNISFDFKARRFVSGAGFDLAERHERWLGSFTREERGRLLAPGVLAELAQAPDVGPGERLLKDVSLRDPINRVLYLDMKLYLENDILAKVDRASMLASLEARVPLLNRLLVEHVTALPAHLKLRGLTSKYLFKEALRGVVPDFVLRRGKKGFGIPVARWLRGPLREEMLELLSPDRVAADGYFEPAAVTRLVDEHLAGRRDHRKQLWTLMVFQRWLDAFGSGRRPMAGSRVATR